MSTKARLIKEISEAAYPEPEMSTDEMRERVIESINESFKREIESITMKGYVIESYAGLDPWYRTNADGSSPISSITLKKRVKGSKKKSILITLRMDATQMEGIEDIIKVGTDYSKRVKLKMRLEVLSPEQMCEMFNINLAQFVLEGITQEQAAEVRNHFDY